MVLCSPFVKTCGALPEAARGLLKAKRQTFLTNDTQRYVCQNTVCATGSFLLVYQNRGCLPEVKQTIV